MSKYTVSMQQYYVYILSSYRLTLYIGVTNDLVRRAYEHKSGVMSGFSSRYNVHKLVYYEIYHDIEEAILREKRLKKWNREWKLGLIRSVNLDFRDLFDDVAV